MLLAAILACGVAAVVTWGPDDVGPRAPTNVTARATMQSVTLRWKPNSADGFAYFAVRRSTQPDPDRGSWTRLDPDYRDPTAVDSSEELAPGSTYYYYVTAVDVAGRVSERSDVLKVTLVKRKPLPAQNVDGLADIFDSNINGPTDYSSLSRSEKDRVGSGIGPYARATNPKHIAVIDDPKGIELDGEIRKVFRFTTYDSDYGLTSNPRTGMGSRPFIEEGDDFYFGLSYMLPPDFPDEVEREIGRAHV